MENPFDSPRLLVEDALEDIASLKEGVGAFVGKDNWSLVHERHPENGHHIFKMRFKSDVPPKLTVRVYGAARSLRDALDHAIYASALIVLGKEPERTKFLLAPTLGDIKNDIKRGKCRDVHEDIIAFMLALEPHEAGNKSLATLNKLRNKTTHRILSPAHLSTGGFGLSVTGDTYIGRMSSLSEWSATRRTLTVGEISADSTVEGNIVPTAAVILNPSLGLGRTPVVHALTTIAGEVERIVVGIEAETARIIAARAD